MVNIRSLFEGQLKMDLPLLFFAVMSLSFSLSQYASFFFSSLSLTDNSSLYIQFLHFYFLYFILLPPPPVNSGVMKNSWFNPVMINLFLSCLLHVLFYWAANFSTPISVHYLNRYFTLNCLFGWGVAFHKRQILL